MTSKETPENQAPKKVELSSPEEIQARLKLNREGELVQLPSGLVFQLKKPSISRLMRDGAFPSDLVGAAIKLDSNELKPKDSKEYVKYLDVIDVVVVNACVNPKVVRETNDIPEGAITVEDLDDQDRIAIYMYAQMGVKPFNSFREKQGDEDSGSDLPSISESKAE